MDFRSTLHHLPKSKIYNLKSPIPLHGRRFRIGVRALLHAEVLQATRDHRDDVVDRPAIRLDREVRTVTVVGPPVFNLLPDLGGRILVGQRRPPIPRRRILLHPPYRRLRLNLEMEDLAPVSLERLEVAMFQHRPAPGRQDLSVQLGQFVDGLGLERPEVSLAADLEDLADRAARLLLDVRVAVDELPSETAGQFLPDARLAGTAEPDEHDVHERTFPGPRASVTRAAPSSSIVPFAFATSTVNRPSAP